MQALKVTVESKGPSTSLKLSGSIDEESALEDIKLGSSKQLIIDIGGVDFINSYGGREWIKWTHNIDSEKVIKFTNCPSIFLEYVNMIEGFIPRNGTIESFKVPYFCEKCNNVTTKSYESKDVKDVTQDVALTTECGHCKEAAEIDVVLPNFFKFLK